MSRVCDHRCDSPRGTVPALTLPHSDTLEAVSRHILTGRIPVTFTGQMVDSSLPEPVEKLTGCLSTWGDSERGGGDTENMAGRRMGLAGVKALAEEEDRLWQELCYPVHTVSSHLLWQTRLKLMDKLFTSCCFLPLFTVCALALSVSANVPPLYKHSSIFSSFCFLSLKRETIKKEVSTLGEAALNWVYGLKNHSSL